ncbi:MAG: hypothetical protein EYC68_20175 [Chloroflexota bacterium]|nr:MAG: hypothetical protein EYC68_20175 [Chloroflexota bacterium]
MSEIVLDRCECGLELPRADTLLPTHAYIGATAGCWALYNELHAKQYTGFGALTPIRVIDAYAVQHHGKTERRAIQSVNAHLVALYLQLEKGYKGEQVNVALQRVLKFADEFVWLEPPTPNGTLTIADVLRAETSEEQANAIENYARDIWRAWKVHRAAVVKWVAKAVER